MSTQLCVAFYLLSTAFVFTICMLLLRVHTHYLRFPTRASAYSWFGLVFPYVQTQTQCQIHGVAPEGMAEDTAIGAVSVMAVVAVVNDDLHPYTDCVLLTSPDDVRHGP